MKLKPTVHLRKSTQSWIWILGLCAALLGQIAVGLHHHDDLDRHDDCPICELAQNPSHEIDPPVKIILVSAFVAEAINLPPANFTANTPAVTRTRGPPLA